MAVTPDLAGPVAGPRAAPLPLSLPAPVTATGPVNLSDEGLVALLKNPSDRLLVVNIWASWCGPCVAELPMLARAAQMYSSATFALVNADESRDQPAAARLLSARGIYLPAYQLIANDPALTLSLAVTNWPESIPVTLVIEPGGRERARFKGSIPAIALDAALR